MSIKVIESDHVTSTSVYSPKKEADHNLLLFFYLMQEKLSDSAEKSQALNKIYEKGSNFGDNISKYLSQADDIVAKSEAFKRVLEYFGKDKNLTGDQLAILGQITNSQKEVQVMVDKVKADQAEMLRLNKDIVDLVDKAEKLKSLLKKLAASLAAALATSWFFGIGAAAAAGISAAIGVKTKELVDCGKNAAKDLDQIDLLKLESEQKSKEADKTMADSVNSSSQDSKHSKTLVDVQSKNDDLIFNLIANVGGK